MGGDNYSVLIGNITDGKSECRGSFIRGVENCFSGVSLA